MKTVLEQINDVEKLIKVTFEWEDVVNDYDKLCLKLRKSLKLDGFRPGKVPMSLAKKHLAPRIQYDFINEMIEKTFENAVKNEGINDYIDSSLEDVKLEEGQPFEYHIKLEVDPEIVLPDYKAGFSVKKKSYIVDDSDIEKYLESVQKERAEIEKVDGEIEKGHYVTCDAIAEGDDRQEDVQWQVGEKPLDKDAEALFVGKKAGEEFEAELTLNNEPVKYTVTVKSVQKHVYPEINDAWVKENLETVETLDAWKEQIKASFEKELNDRAKYEYETNIKNWFKDNMEVTLPKIRIENYLDGMVKQFEYQQGGKSNIPSEEIKKFYKPQAEESVRWFLIEEKIKEVEGIAVTSDDFDTKIESILSEYPEDQREQFKNIYNQENYKKQMELQILSEKILEHIQEFVKDEVEEVKASELTNQQ